MSKESDQQACCEHCLYPELCQAERRQAGYGWLLTRIINPVDPKGPENKQIRSLMWQNRKEIHRVQQEVQRKKV